MSYFLTCIPFYLFWIILRYIIFDYLLYEFFKPHFFSLNNLCIFVDDFIYPIKIEISSFPAFIFNTYNFLSRAKTANFLFHTWL